MRSITDLDFALFIVRIRFFKLNRKVFDDLLELLDLKLQMLPFLGNVLLLKGLAAVL